MYLKTSIVILLAGLSCTGNASGSGEQNPDSSIPEHGETRKYVSQIPLPPGYSRVPVSAFGEWLRARELKKNTTVFLFDGSIKANQDAQFAVLDIPVGKKNLQQCADAVMRMKAEFLYEQKHYQDICFFDNAGKSYRFSAPYTRDNFEKYLEKVFSFCGTASLSKQLKPGTWSQLKPGDVIIRGGFPGHAVMVMDVAVDERGKKIYMISQSYMPAQDIHILKNPEVDSSPWYEVNLESYIKTPEYVFRSSELMTW